MTKEEFNSLRTSDVIENKRTGSRYVILNHYSTEPITQITKDAIKTRMDEFQIISRVLPYGKEKIKSMGDKPPT